MKTIDDLHDALERLSREGEAQAMASSDVFEAAQISARSREPIPAGTGSTSRRRRLVAGVIGVAASVGLVVAVLAGTGNGDQPQPVRTVPEPTAPRPPVPARVAKVVLATVAVGEVRMTTVAFDRIWVVADEMGPMASPSILVFDLQTGEPLGRVDSNLWPGTVGGFSPPRNVTAMVATDNFLWVRTVARPELGPADGGPSEIRRIDPETLVATPNRTLVNRGPLVAFGDRFVAADRDHVEIVREDGVEQAVPGVDEVLRGVAVPPLVGQAFVPFVLHFDRHGLFVRDPSTNVVVRLDPNTGKQLDVGPGPGEVEISKGPGNPEIWWHSFSGGTGLTGAPVDGNGLVGVDLEAPGVRPMGRAWPDDVGWLVDGIDTTRFLVRQPTADPKAWQFAIIDVVTDKAIRVGGGARPADSLRVISAEGRPWLVSAQVDGDRTRLEVTALD